MYLFLSFFNPFVGSSATGKILFDVCLISPYILLGLYIFRMTDKLADRQIAIYIDKHIHV